jgi:type 1 glutamine amidotransferase
MPRIHCLFVLAALALPACASAPRGVGSPCLEVRADRGTRVLVFYRVEQPPYHSSIPQGLAAIEALGRRHRFAVEETEDPATFTAPRLAKYAAVIFLNTTGDVLDVDQQGAFEGYIRAGGGFVGLHAAAATEDDWEWYGRLVGARFKRLTGPWLARVSRLESTHPSTRCLPDVWEANDEWYDFVAAPAPDVTVLATVDEKSYRNGRMGEFHPIAWGHEFDGGRAWYTGMGHTAGMYTNEVFLDHLAGGILWAAGGARKPLSAWTPGGRSAERR